MKSFYHFVLTYRGAHDALGAFAEAVFEDWSFPKAATSFDVLSEYLEMQAHPEMTATVFDELWDVYSNKFGL